MVVLCDLAHDVDTLHVFHLPKPFIVIGFLCNMSDDGEYAI